MTRPPPRPRNPARVRRDRLILVGALAVVALLAAAGAYVMYRTVTTTGEAAIAAMSETDREWLARIERIGPQTTYDEAIDLLGEPDEETIPGLRPSWYVDGAQWNQIRVTFWNGRATRVSWLKLGSFAYEKRFR
jgi:hypothetical protein